MFVTVHRMVLDWAQRHWQTSRYLSSYLQHVHNNDTGIESYLRLVSVALWLTDTAALLSRSTKLLYVFGRGANRLGM